MNWFRQDADGKFLWPGYGENSRVLKWVFERVTGTAQAVDTPIGRLPAPGALDLAGLDIAPGALDELLRVDVEGWLAELPLITQHYEKFGARLPAGLRTSWPRSRSGCLRLEPRRQRSVGRRPAGRFVTCESATPNCLLPTAYCSSLRLQSQVGFLQPPVVGLPRAEHRDAVDLDHLPHVVERAQARVAHDSVDLVACRRAHR